MEATQQPEAKTEVNVYALITDRFIDSLSKGIVPWHKLWATTCQPTNIVTNRRYIGVNAIILGMEEYEHNWFLTFNQANELKGKVKRGATGYPVVYWKDPAQGSTDKGKLQSYKVFNIAQCELPNFQPDAILAVDHIDSAAILPNMQNPPKLRHTEPTVKYEVTEDTIYIPKKMANKKDGAYYYMLFRQLIHATGHDSRLVRQGLVEMSELTPEPIYSKEDLIADIGASFLLSATGIEFPFVKNEQYIAGFLSKLRQDRLLIFLAAKEAQKAVNYILNYRPETEGSQQM